MRFWTEARALAVKISSVRRTFMAKRGSNIYKRKDGRFEGRVHVGYRTDGSKKYKSVYGRTLSEVKDKMSQLYSVKSEKATSMLKLTVRETAEEWLNAARLRVKESSFANYTNIVNKHILPVLGGAYIASLTTSKINEFIMRRTMSMTMRCVYPQFRKARMILYLTHMMQTETRNPKRSETTLFRHIPTTKQTGLQSLKINWAIAPYQATNIPIILMVLTLAKYAVKMV